MLLTNTLNKNRTSVNCTIASQLTLATIKAHPHSFLNILSCFQNDNCYPCLFHFLLPFAFLFFYFRFLITNNSDKNL